MDRPADFGEQGRAANGGKRLRDAAALPAAVAVFIGGLAVISGQRFALLLITLIIDGLLTAGWFAAAAGFGAWIGLMMWGRDHHRPMAAMAMGCAAMLLGVWLSAWAGWLNPYVAWGWLIAGWAGLMVRMKACRQAPHGVRVSWLIVPVAGVVALMIGAAMIAPGILWEPTEPISYDVLEYHLQLPGEWLRIGAMTGLHHNVYSYLPNLLEAGFMQLATIKGGAPEAALCCQLLSAGFALLAAGAIAQVVWHWLGESENDALRRLCAAAAGCVSLALPWTVVTGSMAYDEQAVQFFAAAAMGLIVGQTWDPDQGRGRPWSGLMFGAGLLAGFACLAKLTSIGMVVLPLAGLIVICSGRRWRNVLGFTIGAALPVALFMVRNAAWTGNPLFPEATTLFGTAHWTAEQAARWQQAHQPQLPLIERLARLWNMVLANPQYAFILWTTAGVATGGMIADNVLRRVGVALAVMVALGGAFWLFMTHDQSRFAMPLIVPACVAIGMGLSLVRTRWMRIIVVAALIVWPGAMSWRLWMRQSRIAPLLIDGTAVMRKISSQYRLLNADLAGTKIYAEGWATPLYVVNVGRLTYHTVWDRSKLGELMDAHGVRDALTELAQQGYQYLLIDRAMIRLWMSEGNYGYDPAVTIERLRAIEQAGLPKVYEDAEIVVYQLPPQPGAEPLPGAGA